MARLDDFVADVVRSGLLTEDRVERARSRLEPHASDEAAALKLAKGLIADGSLTPYQAKKLLAGLTKGFFLAEYRILRRLGQGGMGKVYLAVDRAGFKVAIKVLPPKRGGEGSQALARFLREMDLSQRVKHPNLARTIEAGDEGGVYYMVMEYVPGNSLYALVKGDRRGPWRVPDAARYFVQVLDGLNAAHAAGLIHRDIKPSNLMVTPEGDAKILDLGLARATGDEGQLTRPNTVIGTLDYASPEQLSNASSADRRSDLYSVGCTLYFTLAGRAPFEGGDVVNKIYKQRMEDPPPLEKITRGVPAAFAAIVRKLMAKEPNDRYQAGQDLQADLRRWTDPKVVRSILGAEADAALAFRPPAPDLDDEDLRLLPNELGPLTQAADNSLRDLGEAEPGVAPRRPLPPVSKPAVVVPTMPPQDAGFLPPRKSRHDENRWLLPFIVIACLLGALTIALISALSDKYGPKFAQLQGPVNGDGFSRVSARWTRSYGPDCRRRCRESLQRSQDQRRRGRNRPVVACPPSPGATGPVPTSSSERRPDLARVDRPGDRRRAGLIRARQARGSRSWPRCPDGGGTSPGTRSGR